MSKILNGFYSDVYLTILFFVFFLIARDNNINLLVEFFLYT